MKEQRQAKWTVPLLKEISRKGKKAYSMPKMEKEIDGIDILDGIPEELLRKDDTFLPEVSEPEIVEHFTKLEQMTYGAHHGFYPLGSCTMKYNPIINEKIAGLEKFLYSHPLQDESAIQGSLEIMYLTEKMLKEVSGFDAVSLQPAAGAQGEMAGMLLVKAYHEYNGDIGRDEIIIPESAHGTNPATAKAMLGYKVIKLPSREGRVDIKALKAVVHPEKTAGIMITNPNTFGIFEKDIVEIGKIVHKNGGVVYVDGANMNAMMGITKPGEWFNGPAVMHFNLHKTFSTPHGGGGPGSGPIGVTKELEPFMPVPRIEKNGGEYKLDYNKTMSIGKMKSFYGNFGVILRACTYMLSMGGDGLRESSEVAVLNANYLAKKLDEIRITIPEEEMDSPGEWKFTEYKPFRLAPEKGWRMHECVACVESENEEKSNAKMAEHFAKRILDFGFHAPTMYFPTTVKEDLMIEPTETVSKKTLDEFVEVMGQIGREWMEDRVKVLEAPNTLTHASDAANRKMILSWEEYKKKLLME